VTACEAPTVARDVSTPYLGRLGEEGYLAAVAVNCPVLVNCDARSWHSLASRPGGWWAHRAGAGPAGTAAARTSRRSAPDSTLTWASGGPTAQRVACPLAVQIPGIPVIQVLLQPAQLLPEVIGIDGRQLPGGFAVALYEGLRPGDAFLDVAGHGPGLVQRGFLQQHPSGIAGRQADLSVRWLLQAGHHPQQHRLAGAVRPGDASLRAGQELQRHVIKDGLPSWTFRAWLRTRICFIARMSPCHRAGTAGAIAASPSAVSHATRSAGTPRPAMPGRDMPRYKVRSR
jgi:hypothetical protein